MYTYKYKKSRYVNNGIFYTYFLPKSLAKRKIIIATTTITINIPKPIPALKISPISSQLVNENSITNTINNLVILFCMILLFLIV